ncbi:C39 family peptidase [Fulvivirgaceae bacterium BMA10]|uniref:C39 family peptidase n=1 Tax=Splendidivirga corallicola TaxID=3051826 RepID=A0ABT8KNT1_9BACT|nr:C39 family peptidase [Fulvivirgaceae bacterium BMA10]
MKKIVKLSVVIFVFTLINANTLFSKEITSSGDGILIKSIHVTKFPYGRNGKNFDKDQYPDLYFKLFLNRKKTAQSNIVKDCKKGRIPILSGGKMPFRIEQNKLYHLQMLDHDSDRGVGSNRDEEVSSMIQITWSGLISKFGKKDSYLIKDPRYGDVAFILMVEHVGGAVASGSKAYIKYVKPIDQIKVPPKNKVLEGCGPVAAAMVMGYWQTEQGYKIMNTADRYNGNQHPTQTILDFRKKSDTRAWGNQSQSATRKMKMVDALQSFVGTANSRTYGRPKLKVDILWSIRRWDERKSRLKKELREGSPVILLLKKTPPCLTGKWVNSTKVVADHYIVAVGFDDAKKEYYVMPGWSEKKKSTSTGPNVHKKEDPAHCKCSYKEIANADPSLIWIKR